MHIGQIIKCDVANGIGIRCSIFVSGCRNYCKGCFNECTWAFDYGTPYDAEMRQSILDEVAKDYTEGLTILGGEPFEEENQPEIAELVQTIHRTMPQKTIWLYTGYLLDQDLVKGGKKYTEYTDIILSCLDILVDGPFMIDRKNLALNFRGSSNQRIIDMNTTRTEGKIVLSSLNNYID